MDFALWPLMFLCLGGCYGPPQALRGDVERLPAGIPAPAQPSAAEVSPVPPPPPQLTLDDQVRLAQEIHDPASWAERVFAAGRPNLQPSHVIELHRRGVPAGHLDALYAREQRAREADTASRVAEREQYLSRRYDEDLQRVEQMRPVYPAYPSYPAYPGPGYYPGNPGMFPAAPYGGVWGIGISR